MKILFITTAHNGLSQRLYVELTERGHSVDVVLATSAHAMLAAVADTRPELIIAPMLKTAIPESIWRQHACLIVHPGIRGDRGPSSLDWAISLGETTWGVTHLQADAEMDAGPIWTTGEFAMPARPHAKSSLYRNEVTQVAVSGALVAVELFQSRAFKPQPLDYCDPDVRGTPRPSMKQADRGIDWAHDSTATIARKIRAADSSPGLLDTQFDEAFGCTVQSFDNALMPRCAAMAADPVFWNALKTKHARRLADERVKPLALYRQDELAKMQVNFFGADTSYHEARRRFVHKLAPAAATATQHAA
jgi:putative two-component system hydrogenase maturation factor HypX/HoxX